MARRNTGDTQDRKLNNNSKYPGDVPGGYPRGDSSGMFSDSWIRDLFNQFTNGSFGNIDNDAVANGQEYSATDYLNMQYEMNKINQNQQWQQDMYEQYMSIPAQVRQMQEAGLNPALMYGSGASTGSMPSGTSGSGSPAGGNSPMNPTTKASNIVQMISSLLGIGGGLANQFSTVMRNKVLNDLTKEDIRKRAADTEKILVETDGITLDNKLKEIDLRYRDFEKQLNQEKLVSEIKYVNASAEKIFSDISVNNSIIEINGHKIQLIDSNIAKTDAEAMFVQLQSYTEKLTQEQLRITLQYQEAMEKARLQLTNAQSDSLKAQAEKTLSETSLNMLEYMKQEQLLEAGYVDQVIKNMKAERGVKIANTVINGVTSIASAIADFTPAGQVSKLLPSAPDSTFDPTVFGSF